MTEQDIAIEAAVLTNQGGRRANEDTVYTCERVKDDKAASRGSLYIVADGTGGQEGGQSASRMAVTIASEYYYDNDSDDLTESLRSAVMTAHQALYELAQKVPTWAEMSTTFVGAVVHQGQLRLAHVGDSRAYLIRDGEAKLLTRDHVWLEDDENYGALIRWLGGTVRTDVKVDMITQPLKQSDVVVLCSDGLTDVVDREEIRVLVSQHPASVAARKLVELANRRRTGDNISVAVIRYGGHVPSPWRRWAWLGGVLAGLLVLALGVALVGVDRDNQITSTEAIVIGSTATTGSQSVDFPTSTSQPPGTAAKGTVIPTLTLLPSRIEVEDIVTSTAAAAVTVPTSRPARPPTSTPVGLPPTATPKPNVPTATSPPLPTGTPILRLLDAPALLEPAGKAEFSGWDAEVVFGWSDVGLLGENEYYVLVIRHKQGTDFAWTKNTWYDASHDSADGGKPWLSNPDIGPDLEWQVVIARQRTGEAGEDPAGAELSSYSKARALRWSPGGPPQPKPKPTAKPTR